MNLTEFIQSISRNDAPDTILSASLQALWWDAKGDWDKAHELCQRAASLEGDWVHAYLHRKEGDLSNASYWYNRAGKPRHKGTLQEEWTSLATSFLS